MAESESQYALDIALRAAQAAGTLVMQESQPTMNRVAREKTMFADIVTVADAVSSDCICAMLAKFFPDYGILCEEVSDTPDLSKEFLWVVDPLDGTIAYANGLPHFAISVALVRDGEPVVGVLHFPKEGSTYWAEQGKGAYRNGERLRVSSTAQLRDAVLGVGYGYQDRKYSLTRIALPLVDETRYLITYPSITYLLALVSSAALQGCLHFHGAFPWDLAAGVLIVQEAGGKVSDFDGKKVSVLQTENSGILASNGLVHDDILDLIGSSPPSA